MKNENEVVDTKYSINGVPTSNAVKKEDFQKRVSLVFKELNDILSKSFGAYGSTTFISNQAHSTVTKDGYTIMKNLVFDSQKGSPIDHVIYNMASDICSRLNYKVGDGTTTAIIATNAIYNSFVGSNTDTKRYLPRDIMGRMKVIQEKLVKEIE